MKLATRTLGSLLIATAVALKKTNRRTAFERLLRHHDRKAELRAEVLGVDPMTYRSLQKHYSTSQLVRQFGFKDQQDFRQAVFGKIKTELRSRGWSAKKIDRFVASRSDRLSS